MAQDFSKSCPTITTTKLKEFCDVIVVAAVFVVDTGKAVVVVVIDTITAKY